MDKKTVAELIIDRAAAILRKKGWIKGSFARSARGVSVQPDSANATCFCTVGALRRARHELMNEGVVDVHRAYPLAYNATARASGPQGIVEFNDYKAGSVEDVLALLGKAKTKVDDVA